LTEAADKRDEVIERSLLLQSTAIGNDPESAIDRAVGRLGVERSVVASTPFLLFGSVSQVIDRLQTLRQQLGISHVVVRDAAGFAPIVSALAGQ
jgi:hypothetical protein